MLIIFLILTGCSYNEGPAEESGQETDGTETEENFTEKGTKIENAVFPKAAIDAGREVTLGMTISNYDGVDKKLWIETVLKDKNNQKIETDISQIQLKAYEVSKQVKLIKNIPSEIPTGRYTSGITLWEGDPKDPESKKIAESDAGETFIIYHDREDFDLDKKLGRTELKSRNVTISEGMLSLIMPAEKLEGGEVSTINGKGFGIYEARMKVPYAPSSITGFFMYEAPDFYHEIDMEIYNDKSGKILITTYAEGKVRNKYTGNLGFDPGQDFHDYRMEYFEDSLSFYVDGNLIIRWLDGYSKSSMRLMINSWYPTWLKGTPPLEEQRLLVDYIRY